MKKAVLLVTLLALLVGVMSVSAQDTPTLVYWDTMNDQERIVFGDIINTCAADVGVAVDYQYVPFSDAQAQFRTAAQGGKAKKKLPVTSTPPSSTTLGVAVCGGCHK
jgi:arabinogalactan oligomer/maltooligosaccharide transport system substrate-binding protein